MTSLGFTELSSGKSWEDFELKTELNDKQVLVRRFSSQPPSTTQTLQIKEMVTRELNKKKQEILFTHEILVKLPDKITSESSLTEAFNFLSDYTKLISSVENFSHSVLGKEITNAQEVDQFLSQERDSVTKVAAQVSQILRKKLEQANVDSHSLDIKLISNGTDEDYKRLATYATALQILRVNRHLNIQMMPTLLDFMTINPSLSQRLIAHPGISTTILDKILTLYRAEPIMMSKFIPTALNDNEKLQILTLFLNGFVKVNDFNPRLFCVLDMVFTQEETSTKEISKFLKKFEKLMINAESNIDKKDVLNRILLLFPNPAFDLMLDLKIENISLEIVNDYLKDEDFEDLFTKISQPHKGSEWIREWENSLKSHPETHQKVVQYIQRCIASSPYYNKHPEIAFEDKFFAFSKKERETLYLLSKRPLKEQNTILEVVRERPYPEEVRVLVHYFDKSTELGEIACEMYKNNPIVFTHLLALSEKLDSNTLKNLLIAIKQSPTDGAQLMQLYHHPKEELKKIVDVFCAADPQDRHDIIKLARFDAAAFLKLGDKTFTPEWKRFIQYVVDSEQNMKGYSALQNGTLGIRMEATDILLQFIDQDLQDFDWIITKAAEGYWNCCSLLQMLSVVKNLPEFLDYFKQYKNLIDSAMTQEAKQDWFKLAGLHVLKPRVALKFVEDMLRLGPQLSAELVSNLVELAVHTRIADADYILELVEKQKNNEVLDKNESEMLKALSYPGCFEDQFISRLINAPEDVKIQLFDYISSNGIDNFARGFLKIHAEQIEPLQTILSTIKEPLSRTSKENILHALVEHSQFEMANWVAGIQISDNYVQFNDFEVLVTFLTILQSKNDKTIKLAREILSGGGDSQTLMKMQYLSKHDPESLNWKRDDHLPAKKRQRIDYSNKINELYESSPQHPSKLLADLMTKLDIFIEEPKEAEVAIVQYISECIVTTEGGINLIALKEIEQIFEYFDSGSNPFVESLIVNLKYIEQSRGDISTLLNRVSVPAKRNPVYAYLSKSTALVLNSSFLCEEVMSALLIPLRQRKGMGSCFATQSAIAMQSNQKIKLLKDYLSILTNGYIERVIPNNGMLVNTQFPVVLLKNVDYEIESALTRCYEYTLTGLETEYHTNMLIELSGKFIVNFASYPDAKSSDFKGYNSKKLVEVFLEAYRPKVYLKYDADFGEEGGVQLYLKSNHKTINSSDDYAKFLIVVLKETKNALKEKKLSKTANFCDQLIHELRSNPEKVMRFLLEKANPKVENAYDEMDKVETTPWYNMAGGFSQTIYVNSFSPRSKLFHTTIPADNEKFFTGVSNFINHLPNQLKSKIRSNELYRLSMENSLHSYTFMPFNLLSKGNSAEDNLKAMKIANEEFLNSVVPNNILQKLIDSLVLNFGGGERTKIHLESNFNPGMTYKQLFDVMKRVLTNLTANADLVTQVLTKVENDYRKLLAQHSQSVPPVTPLLDMNYLHRKATSAFVGLAYSLVTDQLTQYRCGLGKGSSVLLDDLQATFKGLSDEITFFPSY